MKARQTFKILCTTALSMLLAFSALAAPKSDRTVYVHLFEWTWKDIALECENFLGPNGFGAVQISPPNEHAVLPNRAWYQRYQPVSYQIISRSGNRAEFADMIRRCKAVGVEIIADAVINHMTWVNRSGQPKYGNAGSTYNEYEYPGTYAPWDFHRCGRNGDDSIANYGDRWEVQNCNITKCADLRTETDYVRGKLADYLNDLLSLGVAGFRIDAAKHMPTDDIRAIFSRLTKPFYAFQEVIDPRTEPIRSEEYFQNGDVTEFQYSRKLAHVFLNGKLSWLQNFGSDWGFIPSNKAVVFADNHDIQRGHGGGGTVVTHRHGQVYTLANVFMLAWPYGYPQVMSSYRFTNDEQGPPSNEKGETKRVYEASRNLCGSDWVCEHRWPAIAGMVQFRNYTQSAPQVLKWWSDGNNRIAFARGTRGYVAINKDPNVLRQWFDTGLPAGTYCDITTGKYLPSSNTCTGKTVIVQRTGWAELTVDPNSAIALHGGAKLREIAAYR